MREASGDPGLLDEKAMRRVLLDSGYLAAVVYIAANIVTPFYFPGYDWMSQTVSELSAIGAPSRGVWLVFVIPFGVLITAFGAGVWMAAIGSKSLRITGATLIVHGIVGLFWPPMHLRGAEFTTTDALHIAFTAITIPLMLIQMGFGAAALGRWFRVYSIVSIVVLLAFGILTGLQSPNIAADLPTPNIGVWERISIAAYIVWIAVFSVSVVRREPEALTDRPRAN